MPQPRILEIDAVGKCKIKRIKAISLAIPTIPSTLIISDALYKIENLVDDEAGRLGCQKIDQNAFNNARGEWFELIINSRFYNLSKQSEKFCIFSIPNVTSVNFIDFFNEDIRNRLKELESHLITQDIELKMSNPDFLCVNLARFTPNDITNIFSHNPITQFNEANIDFLDNLYRQFISKCGAEDILFAISAKTSVRPDRRYQFVHEGNIIKALAAHLQTRLWKTNFNIAYYALTNKKPTNPDKKVLRTAAVSSITNVFSKSVRAVDDIFQIERLRDINAFVRHATSSLQ